jgi:hypothetical protein
MGAGKKANRSTHARRELSFAVGMVDGPSLAFFTGMVFIAGVAGSFVLRRILFSSAVLAVVGWFARRPLHDGQSSKAHELEQRLREREILLQQLIAAADARIAVLDQAQSDSSQPALLSAKALKASRKMPPRGRPALQPLVVQLDDSMADAAQLAEAPNLVAAVSEFSRWRQQSA